MAFLCMIICTGMAHAQSPEPLVVPDITLPPRASARSPLPVSTAGDSGTPEELPPDWTTRGHYKAKTWIFEGEYLLLATRGLPQTYAISGTVPQLGPLGGTQTVPSGYENGFRAGIGWISPNSGIETLFRYTYYSNKSDAFSSSPTTSPPPLIPPANIYPTLTVPGLVTAVNAASATSTVAFNLGDIELGKTADITESFALRGFAGARFANMNQSLMATYTGGDMVTDTVNRKITFNGGGLRLGGSADYTIAGGWGIRLNGSASLITGAFAGSQTEVANNAYILSISDKYIGLVPMADLGLALRYRTGGWNLSIGYEFQNWFNMLQGFNIADDTNPAKLIRDIGNIGFDGMAVRAEYVW
jgi:hypothetical protein